jgi:hypothetical protein
MLNVPTLWTAFVINFLALGLIWAYILHSYPSFKAARYWTGSALALAAGSLIATLTLVTDSLFSRPASPRWASGVSTARRCCGGRRWR